MSKTTKLTKQARIVTGIVIGVIAGMVVGMWSHWWTALLAGWDAFVLVFVGMILVDFASHDGESTARVAKRDDMGEFALDVIVILASLASLVAVAALLAAKNTGIPHLVLGLVSVVASWLTVQTLYTLRYAVLYYRGDEGGIDFNDKTRPRFSDFAYLAFTIGMTYQVSDTNLTQHAVRRAALAHALVSFVFGVAIIATTINLFVGFASAN